MGKFYRSTLFVGMKWDCDNWGWRLFTKIPLLNNLFTKTELQIFAYDTSLPQGKFRTWLLWHYRGLTCPQFNCGRHGKSLIYFGGWRRKDVVFLIVLHLLAFLSQVGLRHFTARKIIRSGDVSQNEWSQKAIRSARRSISVFKRGLQKPFCCQPSHLTGIFSNFHFQLKLASLWISF